MAPPSKSKLSERHSRSKKGVGNSPPQPHQAHRSNGGTSKPQSHGLPFEIQQIILNTFTVAFPITQDPDNLKQVIQNVKGHLFNRDFSSAFGQPSYLQAYALRWSAARALGYLQIFTDPTRQRILLPFPEPGLSGDDPMPAQLPTPQDLDSIPGTQEYDILSGTKVVCIGGGAGAEVVALAAAYRLAGSSSPLQIVAVDSADWSDPVTSLSSALSTAPPLPVPASESFKARPENQAMLPESLSSKVSVNFLHQDVLSWPHNSLEKTFKDISLCTVMFTLNELFSASLPKTTAFLLHLTDSMRSGSYLLVVDSPGSYSEITLGQDKQAKAKVQDGEGGEKKSLSTAKRYPMKWLLDHTLLEIAGQVNTEGEAGSKWTKIESEDSLWFRIDQKDKERLKYPIELENMRYQLHLYRRE